MPDRLIPVLRLSAIALLVVYVGLVVTTIFFATWQTQLTSSVRDTEDQIGLLETQYYSTIARITTVNPTSAGFVTPHQVQYVAVEATRPGLSKAGN
jgi:Tfp pilus assembly protein PilN